MSKIVKNNTASPVEVADVGITITASGQYTIPATDYLLWAASDDIITFIGDSTVTINDGSSDLSISDGSKLIQGIFPNPVGIASGDDQTAIGHSGDRLKVDSQVSQVSPITVNTTLRYNDMNVSNGGIARDTVIGNTWNQVYSYSGTGLFFGFVMTLEKLEETDLTKTWVVRLVVDGVEVFSSNGLIIADVVNQDIYNYSRTSNEFYGPFLGIQVRDKTLRFQVPSGNTIEYSSSVKVYIKKLSDSKKFKAGLITLTKES